MTPRRPLRFTLFAFDLLRLAAVIGALSAYKSSGASLQGGALGAHATAFASPQALFALMALFAWLDPVRYAAFPPLYAAGKAVSAVSVGAWLLGALPEAVVEIGLGNPGAVTLAGTAAFVVLYDLISAAAAIFLIGGYFKGEENAEGRSRTAERAEEVEHVAAIDPSAIDSPATDRREIGAESNRGVD